ncbi:MAG: tryptophan--tRNA ligase [Chloroflexi bacterium]|nr:MAG: tryptophan--tRNA ligase [Anaerolineaceae bacterium 4572_32.2]RLC69710.1 MAG: tryptophan--tRNA ligase [Chloroflexota bacterium]RLC78428.1 MAG: tryptophan--tRNA ligase [Chloroflexota bacterium]HEY74027.1 tryptophan--tRNA ligase [Thermoflexia bacterium]
MTNTKKGRVFSGARPTGRQHLGNYLGAIRNYVALQDDYDCVYCVVDLHALTTLEDTDKLRGWTYEMTLDWLAAGMNPDLGTIIFVQSHVPQVTELHLLLSMATPLGWLTRLPTFKDKVRQQPDNVNYGLVGYPVLMAADIALYKADVVPVGVDQAPHLEFTREIVRRFNHHFGEVLIEPQAKHTEFTKVLGIDGEQKMSKSLDNHIEIAASPEEIEQRVMQMKTDPARKFRSDPGHPEVCNLFSLHSFFSADQVAQIEQDCRGAGIGCVQCKRLFAQNLSAHFAPFRERRAELAKDPDVVWDVLAEGARRASVIASEVISEVKDAIGLPKPR